MSLCRLSRCENGLSWPLMSRKLLRLRFVSVGGKVIIDLCVEGSEHWIYKLQSQCAAVRRQKGEGHISTTEAGTKPKLCECYPYVIDAL